MRVAFLGNDPWSVPSLEAVAGSRHRVALVVTRDPRPAGRKRRPRPTAVAEAARRLDLPLLETPTVKRGAGWDSLRSAAPDVLAVVAYGEILPLEVLELPAVAPVNVHFSLLPRLRGADPVRRAILQGEARTGVTTIRMDEGLDTGPILLQVGDEIRDEDHGGSLGARLSLAGGRLLVRTLDGLERGEIEPREQDHDAATLAPKLRPEEEWIDWGEPAAAVWRLVRALSPEPGARTRFRDRVLKVLRARPVDGREPPGSIVEAGKHRLVVAAGRGALDLEEVVLEGRRPMSGAELARGQRPVIGERLG
ncbi:MAG: methionyl-tRNA formyltransferase [Actinomycetota bacterium]